jgi:glutathione S-transferase
MTLRLVTIGPSHYCEKARWALERAGLAYEERAFPPGFHRNAVRAAGGRFSTPVLVTPEGSITDSTEILAYADRHGAGLFTDDESRRLEAWFDDDVGPHVRRAIYAVLLPDAAYVRRVFRPGLPPVQYGIWALLFPLAIRAGMRRYMKIYPEESARSLAKLREVCDQVAAMLSDGRRYLTGDRFTAADLCFAALLAPAVVPPEYGHPLPVPGPDAPPELTALVESFRAHPAGQFVLRVYREDRRAR